MPGDKVFSFNKNNRKIFIDKIIYIWFDKDRMGLRLISILGIDKWIGEFDVSIKNKYLDQSYINDIYSFISLDEKLFFDYINEYL